MFSALCCFAVKLKPLKAMKFIKKQRKRTKPGGGGVGTSSRIPDCSSPLKANLLP